MNSSVPNRWSFSCPTLKTSSKVVSVLTKQEAEWEAGTVNPLYKDIRYNSKIRYNVNLFCTKIRGPCIFSLIFPCFLLGNMRFVYLLESPRRGDSNKYTKRMIYNRKHCSKVSIIDALDGSYQVSLQQHIRFYSKMFGNKHRRYSEGPLYLGDHIA